MPRDIALRVALDEQIEVARVHIAANGRVGSYDFFALRLASLGVGNVEVSGEGNVLANGETEDGLLGG